MQQIDGEADARRRGRRTAMTAYYVIVAIFIVLAASNVTWQVWSPAFEHFAPMDCKEGLGDLTRGIERARQVAGSYSEQGEDVALAHFRGALAPEWDKHDAISASCRGNHELAVALDVIERLRYAEERAVRREVSDLAPLRKRAGQILTNELQR